MTGAQRARNPHAPQPTGEAARRPAPRRAEKSATAFRTISEVADDLEVPQHVLRFWETKFPQIRPMKRGGGRRYYRPEDIDLLRAIRDLLYEQGYTIKGVQKLMREGGLKIGEEGVVETQAEAEAAAEPGAAGTAARAASEDLPLFRASMDDQQLREIRGIAGELSELRDRLRKAIDGR
ncbi:MerR family transcriptional regulator [Dongia sedimenti]|uniref:MerR family transcriptional regulator n=1 Tax=Dongia sedimenti TaxID=3064282 RepID=A0ABU0YMK8_9PROT|nr:MerR family transcriptional regulator [Rhodospirillaceae bacterium R-7]